MRTTTMSAPGWRQTRRSALAWTALAGAFAAALLALALSAPPAQSAERSAAERSATTPVTGGYTLLKLDAGTAAVLADAGVRIEATGPAIGPAGSTTFAFPIVGGEVNKKQLSGRIVHSGGLAISAGNTKLVVKRFVSRPGPGRVDRQGSRSRRAHTAAAPRRRHGRRTGITRTIVAQGRQRQAERHGGSGTEPDVQHRPFRGRPADREGNRHRPHRADRRASGETSARVLRGRGLAKGPRPRHSFVRRSSQRTRQELEGWPSGTHLLRDQEAIPWGELLRTP